MKYLASFFLLVTVTTSAAAQTGATITGIVRDSLERPLAAAEVVARPGNHRTRSDSTGRFTFTGLDGGNYKVSARKFGYAPADWDLSLSKGGRTEISLVLPARMPMLDTVVVTAGRECPPMSLDGFMCRRQMGGGLFLDYTDIDDKEPIYTADIFHDIKGFRIDVRPSRNGPVRVPVLTNFGCISSIVDGRPVSLANRIPEIPQDIVAMEIYLKPDSVPKQYERYVAFTSFAGRCALVAYWTTWAATTKKR